MRERQSLGQNKKADRNFVSSQKTHSREEQTRRFRRLVRSEKVFSKQTYHQKTALPSKAEYSTLAKSALSNSSQSGPLSPHTRTQIINIFPETKIRIFHRLVDFLGSAN